MCVELGVGKRDAGASSPNCPIVYELLQRPALTLRVDGAQARTLCRHGTGKPGGRAILQIPRSPREIRETSFPK